MKGRVKMTKSILVVCDLEKGYAESLMDFLNVRRSVPFEIHAFSEMNLFMEYAKDKSLDVLLISEEAMYDIRNEIGVLNIGEIFVLSQEGDLASVQGHRSIYKYQNSENILREVMCYYAESAVKILPCSAAGNFEMIAVYSPVKRTLKTSFAMTAGQIIGENKKVLYINLEEYAGFNSLFKTTYMTDMSDLMYYISQQKPNFIWKLASMVQSIGNLDFIPPALSPLDIKNITSGQWLNFFKELQKCDYDTVILDIGESVQGIYDILRMCSRIYTPTRDDGISYAKMEQYEAMLRIMEYDDVLEKTRKLSFSYFKGLEKGLDRLVYSELGQYTRKVLMTDGVI